MSLATPVKKAAVSSLSDAGTNEKTLRAVRASSLNGAAVMPRQFVVSDILPSRNVTILSGDGGLGKSLIAKHICLCMASARPWLGRQTMGGPVVFVSAEDELDEIHRRLLDISRAENVSLEELQDLHIVSLVGKDAIFAVPNHENGGLKRTALFERFYAILPQIKPKLLVLDTLADIFGGNENDRTAARSFISLLRGLAIDFDMAVLLIAHPSLSGMASGSGSSGSTGWSNSVRSRLYLQRPKSDEEDDDEDVRLLTVKKANYAKAGTQIRLRWRAGSFVLDDDTLSAERQISVDAKASAADSKFIELLTKMNEQGRTVSSAPSSNYAPSLFEKHPDAKGFKKRAFALAMERLLASGQVALEEIGPPSKRRLRLIIQSVPVTSNSLPT